MNTQTGNTFHFPILIKQDEDGVYIVSCPSFQGCHSFVKTVEEALANSKQVIEMCLEETPAKEVNKLIGFCELQLNLA